MMEKISTKKTIGANDILLETGHLAKQANGAVLLDIHGTVVLATACMTSDTQEEKDFFPLIVDYQERTYAAGKIPGGFFKREGRPKEAETLTARVVDRSIRPLFPEGMRNGVQVICSVISSDGQNDPDIQAVNAASTALVISDIPFNGPIACVRVGRIDGSFVVNPTYAQREKSDLDVVVSATKDKVVMIETKAQQIDEATIIEALQFGHEHIRDIIDLQLELKAKVGKE
jgi:polyribonucleotide nucleotidyltransferase